jgi:hypothetical protein
MKGVAPGGGPMSHHEVVGFPFFSFFFFFKKNHKINFLVQYIYFFIKNDTYHYFIDVDVTSNKICQIFLWNWTTRILDLTFI